MPAWLYYNKLRKRSCRSVKSTKELLRKGKSHVYTSFSCYFSYIYTFCVVLFSLTEVVNKRQTSHLRHGHLTRQFFPRSCNYFVWHTNKWLIYPFPKVNNQQCNGNSKEQIKHTNILLFFVCFNACDIDTGEHSKVISWMGSHKMTKIVQSSKLFVISREMTPLKLSSDLYRNLNKVLTEN